MQSEKSRELGARLRLARRAVGFTLAQAGAALGRSKQAVSAWEKGNSELSALQLAALAECYGISADRLLFGVRPCQQQLVGARPELLAALPAEMAHCCAQMVIIFGRPGAPDRRTR